MSRRTRDHRIDLDSNPRREFWYSVLTMFPFSYFPIMTLLAVLSALIIPYLSGIYER